MKVFPKRALLWVQSATSTPCPMHPYHFSVEVKLKSPDKDGGAWHTTALFAGSNN